MNSEAEVTGTNLTRIITSGVFFSVGQKLCLLPLGHGGPEHGQIGLGELYLDFVTTIMIGNCVICSFSRYPS